MFRRQQSTDHPTNETNTLQLDSTRAAETFTAAALLTNANACATAASAGALLVLKQGTVLSHKNWKRGALSVVSVVSLAAAIFAAGTRDTRLSMPTRLMD